MNAPAPRSQPEIDLAKIAKHVPLGFECRSCGGAAYNWLMKISRFQKTGDMCCPDFKDWVAKASAMPLEDQSCPK